MELYRTKIQDILKRVIGDRNALDVDYKSIDEKTSLDDIDNTNVRGSVRLMSGDYSLPEETEKIVKTFLKVELP